MSIDQTKNNVTKVNKNIFLLVILLDKSPVEIKG